MASDINIATLTHPDYDKQVADWKKFRRTYAAGKQFVEEYLIPFSRREGAGDFEDRKSISYCPAHAKAALNDIKNAIFQRTADVTREGGSESYMSAVLGEDRGVDRVDNSMNSFIGREVLPELLSMGKVGVYVDSPNTQVLTLADQKAAGTRPYIYTYRAEDIRSWSTNEQTQEFTNLLLRDHVEITEPDTGLVTSIEERFRLLSLIDGQVSVQFYNATGDPISRDGTLKGVNPIILDLNIIPFVPFVITASLLTDVADYQIAHVNLASSDLNYAFKSNYPFYVEQFDPASELYVRQAIPQDGGVTTQLGLEREQPIVNKQGLASQASRGKDNEINTGTAAGRRYPMGTERPSFINPSAEPLIASMDKQERMKQEIKQLVNLAVTNITPQRSSAESKEYDERGLEAGVSYIGLELEFGERRVAQLWSRYENTSTIATVKYPRQYNLRSDSDRRLEANELKASQETVPSKTYKKEVAKKVADLTMGSSMSNENMEKVKAEIESSEVFTTDPETIRADHQAGLVGDELASLLRGYPPGEVEKARTDRADRLALIQAAQTTGVRGVDDGNVDPSNPPAQADKDID